MKRAVKKFARAAVLVLLCTVFALSSCGGGEGSQKEIDTAQIAKALSEKTPIESAWINEDQTFIKEYTALPDFVKSSAIYYAQNTNNLDEFGVFWVETGKAKMLRLQLAEEYLKKRYDENLSWYNSYMPAETPKLRDAEVRVYGDCVVYAILSAEKRTAFFDECDKLLKNEE